MMLYFAMEVKFVMRVYAKAVPTLVNQKRRVTSRQIYVRRQDA